MRYILERRAFTSPQVSQTTEVDINLVYGVVARLVRSGVAWERYRVGGQGRPATVYALFDASEDQVREAAALYKDSVTDHVKRLDDYLIDTQYRVVAEEVIEKHLTREGTVRAPMIARILGAHGLKGESHRDNARRLITSMGYEVTY